MSTSPQSAFHLDNSRRFPDYLCTTDPGLFPVRVEEPPAAQLMAKRAIDVIGSALGLLAIAPLMVAVALLVRLDSPGPVFFRQRRRGLGGAPFGLLKFRTMCIDAEDRMEELEARNESAGGILFKIQSDPRVTRIGYWLRRTSLDELPQLINILKGEMSLVGPRPLQIRDCNLLEQHDPEGFRARHSVPQGLTGAWQVGGRSAEDCAQMIRRDLDYVENWSLALDLKIIVKTIPAVLSGRGAC